MSHTTLVQSTVMTEACQVTTFNVTTMNTHRRSNPIKLNLDDQFVTLCSPSLRPQ